MSLRPNNGVQPIGAIPMRQARMPALPGAPLDNNCQSMSYDQFAGLSAFVSFSNRFISCFIESSALAALFWSIKLFIS